MVGNLIARASTSIIAPSDKIWKALVDPVAIKKYMFGTTVVSDWRVGSSIVWKGEWQGKPYEDKGKILQLSTGHLMQYNHVSGPPGKEESHIVTIELTPDRNHTHLVLTQDGSATEESRVHSEKNWEKMLAELKKYVEYETDRPPLRGV